MKDFQSSEDVGVVVEGSSGNAGVSISDLQSRPSSDRAADGRFRQPETAFVQIDGDRFTVVDGCENLAPFLVNVISDDDHWMFVTSNGAITAGRRTPDEALFPYRNQDQLIDSTGSTGALAILRVRRAGDSQPRIWEPWSPFLEVTSANGRRLCKDLTGSCVIFEESDPELGLRWRHSWSFSSRYGIVRRAEILNMGSDEVSLHLLDGLRNILPHGLDQSFQSQYSVLGDAYKKNELLPEGIGVFSLSTIPTDRAEPNESLRTTVAWSVGLEVRTHLLSSTQVAAFRAGLGVFEETAIRGRRGAFLVESDRTLVPGETMTWWTVADVAVTAEGLGDLAHWLGETEDPEAALEASVWSTREGLRRRVASVDGIQNTADERRCWRHFSNALFNGMRGGLFEHGYGVPRDDFLRKLEHFNRGVFQRHAGLIGELPERIDRSELEQIAAASGDPDLRRLAGEYLPLSFSRRHGDPSRPWNRFAIDIREANGSASYAYQGNWRDIFQNWEALIHSFPEYAEATILRFLNSSTADGYNPYRLTDLGFEWEVANPEEPWSNIGYWGDHQIIYLLRLLEASERFHPGRLTTMLDQATFAYARVPYRIRGYQEILGDPRNSVDFDSVAAAQIEERIEKIGADGRLLHLGDDSICRVSLIEKLLVPLLAKLSNFVPGGGIWMNTQRPEWNDANNALVGFGVSVVTLGYVHRYLQFLIGLLEKLEPNHAHELSLEVVDWLREQGGSLARSGSPGGHSTPAERRALLDSLGAGATSYRSRLYRDGLSGVRSSLATETLLDFVRLAQVQVQDCLRQNRREDGLYHAYNLLVIGDGGGIGLQTLDEMLEGQVSILSSGLLDPTEALSVLEALRKSRLYREDQGSYLLYPDRQLPLFQEKNRIAPAVLRRSHLLMAMVEAGDSRIVVKDREGVARFNGSFHNASDLRKAMDALDGTEWAAQADNEMEVVEAVYEDTFHHQAFTGRSGTFFAYEGLGSIYWHMVSKLIVAIQENHRLACGIDPNGAPAKSLAHHYHETLEGLGIHKEPSVYGAFPTDAYSHTPAHAGAQQPGMTGQVKEDLLTRWGELGVSIIEGRLAFAPRLLRKAEFRRAAGKFVTHNTAGQKLTVDLPPRSLAFTFCQVPVIFELSDRSALEIQFNDGTSLQRDEAILTREESASVYQRSGTIRAMIVRPDSSKLHH